MSHSCIRVAVGTKIMWVMDPICLLHWHKRSLSRYALFNVMPHFRIYNNSFCAPLSRGSRTPLSAADVETETEKQDWINNENIYWTRLEMGCCWVNTDFLIESTVGILLSVQDYICRHDGCWWISQGHLNQRDKWRDYTHTAVLCRGLLFTASFHCSTLTPHSCRDSDHFCLLQCFLLKIYL